MWSPMGIPSLEKPQGTLAAVCPVMLMGNVKGKYPQFGSTWTLGVDKFILSGFPHVEECRRVSSQVVPLVQERVAASTR